MPEQIVRIADLYKSYYRDSIEIPVLRNINFEIQEGEFLALMGPSGSGKTTLLNMIAGIDQPTSGTMSVAGEDISRLSDSELARWRSRHIGFIFQFYNLLPVLMAYENVELPLLLTKLSKGERREHVETALNIVGLGDRMKHYPRQLSGGQEQRVAIARAIVTDPTLILADEPTAPLDSERALNVIRMLNQMAEQYQTAIIVVTHDEKIIPTFKRIYHIRDGRTYEEAGEGKHV